MKVGDLEVGGIYRLSHDPRIGYRTAPTPMKEASRLALFVLNRKQDRYDKPASEMPEPLIYVGPKMVYGGKNGDTVINEKTHHFVRPNGKRLYIYGEHIKHILPFTQG